VRVALAEDGMLFREGVARLLGEAGFEITASCETAEELLSEVAAAPPDIAIVDIRMPPTHTDEGLRAALEIRERHPSVGVLVLSQYAETGLAMQLLADSVEGVGYLLKERVGDMADFTAAVRRVGSGGSAIDPAIVSQLLSRRRDTDPLYSITPREREVLELMAEGRSNQGIADRLGVSERAVQKHITSIFGKLGLTVDDDDHRRVLAVLAYLRTNPAG
jgi:DNA-binding NarL/FixJ family response regulator